MAAIEFSRGDEAHHSFYFPASSWTPGGTLFFAAKPQIDDDVNDTTSQVNGVWDDGDISDVTIKGIAYKKYACTFPPSATDSIPSNGADSLELKGEFQWVSAGGKPITFPAKDDKLDCVVYFDVKRKKTL